MTSAGSVSEYDTVGYHWGRMWRALGLAIGSFLGLLAAAWLEPEGLFGYICAGGVLVGICGFFDHRRYMKKLMIKEPEDQSGSELGAPTLRKQLEDVLGSQSLEGLTDEDLELKRREIEVSLMALAFGDPRGVAELESDLRQLRVART